jgi:uncharacterized protein YkwD
MLVALAGALVAWLLAAFFILSICRTAAHADRQTRGRRLVRVSRRGATASLAVAAVSLPLVPDDAAAACANRDLQFEANPGAVRVAMLCEIGAVRDRRDLRRLRPSAELETAAGLHATDMVQRRYFSHTSPGGGDLADRARRSGFAREGCSWRVGEILAWGVGRRSTARRTVRAWLDSPSHRHILLSNRYGRLGLGTVYGNPAGYTGGVTVAAVVGRRHC